ncbi:Golgin [Citrus sinensis]|uniref:Golgin n=1 Tax=Citrus sinensis TaxID=2711 RepID=A0ACB8J420_CITSI|nr:Golgin [Citrus sinensis]
MSGGSTCSSLHRLISDSVRPCTEAEVVSLTKEKEKELLASLSQVLRQIQLWTRQLESDSDDDELRTQSEDHRYLSYIIADLVFLLTLKSSYVQHLAVKILVAISGFLATSGSNWGFFIRFLCLCMELVVTNALSFSSASSMAGLENSHCNSSSLLVVKPRLKNAGWSTLAEIVRVLRSILKCLNQDSEYDDNLAEVYLDSVYTSLSNMPWDSLDVIYNSQNSFSLDTLDEESRVMLLGNLIQLFCSMVEQCGSVDDTGRSQDKHPFFGLVTNLVPKLFYWCLSMQGQRVITCIRQYFRHKLLLLHNYFQELLWQPIASPGSVQDDCLEGSPFLLSNSDGEAREQIHFVESAAGLESFALLMDCGAECRFNKRKWTAQDTKEDILFHVSNVFNPVHLFHLFLAELHYDHQVLLDYLISKDTGTDCAEYLLRCLRLVSDSWPLFMEFSLSGKVTNQSSDKRRKMLLGSSDDQFGLASTTLKNIPSLEEECKSDLEYSYQHYATAESHYKKAKECLFSLKTSVENLHQKNLFQYNPEVLLKRNFALWQDDRDNSKGGPLR